VPANQSGDDSRLWANHHESNGVQVTNLTTHFLLLNHSYTKPLYHFLFCQHLEHVCSHVCMNKAIHLIFTFYGKTIKLWQHPVVFYPKSSSSDCVNYQLPQDTQILVIKKRRHSNTPWFLKLAHFLNTKLTDWGHCCFCGWWN